MGIYPCRYRAKADITPLAIAKASYNPGQFLSYLLEVVLASWDSLPCICGQPLTKLLTCRYTLKGRQLFLPDDH